MQKSLTTIASLLTAVLMAAGATACKEAQAKTKGVGDVFRPFIIKNCGTGERYCQVCAYGGKPTIMVVADVDDTSVDQDLMKVQKILDASKDKALTAFALFGQIEGGKFKPVADDDAAAKKLKAKAEKLKLSYPVTLVPAKYTEAEKKGYAPFVDAYHVAASRRVMLADAANKVLFAETIDDEKAESQFEQLEKTIQKL